MKLVRIPQERIGAVIGKEGEVKRFIEERIGITMDVDSGNGDVMINDKKAKDPLLVLKVIELVRAIGRGFSPEKAFQLLNEDMYFEVIDMRDYAGKSQKHIRRIKARIIGKRGRTRKLIEQLTGSDISIYGSTVSIISNVEDLDVARQAVDMLLGGSEHSMVYRFMERKRREKKMAHLEHMFSGLPEGPEAKETEALEDQDNRECDSEE